MLNSLCKSNLRSICLKKNFNFVHSRFPSPHGFALKLKSPLQVKYYSSSLSDAKNPEKEPVFPYYVAYTEEGTVRVDTRKSPQLIGVKSSRGVRPYNQDRSIFRPIRIPGMVADRRDKGSAQAMFFSVFDGHGGEECSQFLLDNLHKEISSVRNQDLFSIVDGYRHLGERWANYVPETLKNMVDSYSKEKILHSFLTLEERLTLAFIKTDLMTSHFDWSPKTGSTACSVVVWDSEGLPFWSKDSTVQLTVANCGDSRAILCNTADGGLAQPLSNPHRPSLVEERSRLEKYGAIFSIDSYGEERAMSMVANTRAFGDWLVKPFGIIAEPEIISLSVSGTDAAFLVIASDGITDVLTDQEIVDIAKGCPTAEKAAEKIYIAAETLNSQDNMTVIVVRLAGWDVPTLADLTKDFRLERMKNAEEMEKFRGSITTNTDRLESEYKDFLSSSKSKNDSNKKPSLVSPDKLLYKIFNLKSNKKFFSDKTNSISSLSGNGFTHSPDKNKLSIRVIEDRLASLKAKLTLKLLGEDIILNPNDSSDILPIDQAMKMSIKVLGKSDQLQGDPNKPTQKHGDVTETKKSFSLDQNKYNSMNSFHSKSAHLKYNILISLDELKRAWKLLGISSIQTGSKD
ncbi:Protein phosphatase 2C-like protein [Smittium mucronatum]|uniref:Protein phosphatase 2C-like protein n=1 Tax=Smittium mucronatum TaxID=133383 RepID=A0A1R0GWF1_9FUNG|nr:Protein phosphatase 2C-like protein [Smittium mucronatum]